MSVLCSNDKGWVISHYDYTKNLYRNVLSQTGRVDLTYSENLFNIITPLMKNQEAQKMFETLYIESCSQTVSRLKKRPLIETQVDIEVVHTVQNVFKDLMIEAKKLGHFNRIPSKGDLLENNAASRNFVNEFLEENNDCETYFEGGNTSDDPQIVNINKKQYVIPPRCSFISSDISNFYHKLIGKMFDFILLDPPWSNKFVKRKRRKCPNKGYKMMENETISTLPIDKLLKRSGLVGIWCTNCPRHVESVKESFFPKWGLEYVSTWYWLKVTLSGDPLCSFSNSNGKRPYERILFGANPERPLRKPEHDKCIISTPSAIHSHKPPLSDILKDYLPMNATCLELFARYLQPGWTSVGNQVILLQSLQLYKESRE